MNDKTRFTPGMIAGGALGIVLVIGLTSGIGAYLGNRIADKTAIANLPPIELHAGTASRTNSLSMATGLVDGNVEGLYVLDHVSGNLQCWVLNQKTGQVGGIYTANVAGDLLSGKTGEPEYQMTTGNFFFSGSKTGNISPGQSVCYVADSTSGNVVGYGLVYDRQAIIRGVVQSGQLRVICKGTARLSGTERDQ